MTRIIPGFEACLGRSVRLAVCRAGDMAGDASRAPALATRIRSGLLRSALLAATTAAMVLTGIHAASAAMGAAACDSAAVVARALPAIVNITVVKVIRGDGSGGEGTSSDAASAAASDDEHIAVFVGSGAVIDPSGIIITNKHVIQNAAMIRVIFHDKSEVSAQLIAASALVDLALLKVNLPAPLPALRFGDSDTVQVGQQVVAVGNPLGLGTSVSTGVVSGLNRDLMRSPFDDYIQTDASINPGNSGGPLLDCAGDIIGVNTALLSNNKLLGSIGLGFAMPSDDARYVAGKLRNPDTDLPTWIGLNLQDLTAQLAKVFGREDMTGALVTGVEADSPAAQASLAPGDIITRIGGRDAPDARAILRTVVMQPADAPIALSVWRQGHTTEVTVRGRPWPHVMALRSEVLASATSVARAQAQGLGLGIHLAPITAEDRQRFGLGDITGVLVDQVTPGSQAESRGLVPGDVIEQVGSRPTTTPEDAMRYLAQGATAAGDLVSALIHGKASTRWVALYVGRIDVTSLLTTPDLPQSPSLAAAPGLPAGPSLAHDAAAGPR